MEFELSEDFTIECIGETEQYVYDIEVEGIHNFFANDILVHNSILCDFSDVVAKDCEGMNDEEITNHLNDVANKLNGRIKEVFDDFGRRWNCPKNMISFKREKIARSGFWVAKKRYALHVIDNEGVRYAKPKTKITGLESVRSSTPPYYRKKIKEAIEKILSGTNADIISFIREQEKHMREVPIQEISHPRGVSNMEKYIQPNGCLVEKCIPIGVRAAYQYNKLCERFDYKDEAPIKSGDKFRSCFLIMPNPSHENIIGFRDKLPESFGLHDFLDVQEQYEKGFFKPVKKMLDAIGWKDGTVVSLF